MSIDVTIRQGFFGRKTMPLDVILGDRLQSAAAGFSGGTSRYDSV